MADLHLEQLKVVSVARKKQCLHMFYLRKYKALLNGLISVHRGPYTHIEMEVHYQTHTHTIFF